MYQFKSKSTFGEKTTPESTTGYTLPTGFDFFDKNFQGFRCSSLSLIDAPKPFLENFVYKTIIENILVWKKEVIFVDCGNTLSPYKITKICRNSGIDERGILKKIMVSRPFTAYQLNTLIDEGLKEVIERKPILVVFSQLINLFQSDDVERQDAEIILKRVLKDIKNLKGKFATLVTNSRRGRKRYLSKLESNADSVYHLQDFKNNRVRIELEKDPVFYPKVVDIPFAYGPQTILENYRGE